jgi:RNA polymerase sigma factor (sigma-70 family)
MPPLENFARRMRNALRRRGCSREEAQDIVQESFVRFYASPGREEIRNPEGYLTRTALNISVDQVRRSRGAPFISGVDVSGVADLRPGPDAVIEARERQRRLTQGLNALKDRPRRILLAHRLSGLSYREIARLEGISESAVEKHISRSVFFLMEHMAG